MLSYRSNILSEIERLKVKLPVREKPTPEEEQIISLYGKLSLKQVAQIMGCHLETIRRKLKKFGVERRPAHKNIHSQAGRSHAERRILKRKSKESKGV